MPATIANYNTNIKRINYGKPSLIKNYGKESFFLSILKLEDVLGKNKPHKTLFIHLDDEVIHLPIELSDIASEIKRSEYILSLKPYWDDNKALTIPKNVWKSAVELLINYSKNILESSIDNTTIKCPEINPCPNGSIDLSWRTAKARFLVNVRVENNIVVAYYYGDLYNEKSPISSDGACNIDKLPNWIIVWMKEYLK